MAKGFFSRGFLGRRREPEIAGRLPPGQYLTNGFPVLSAGPTPYTPKAHWDFTVVGAVETSQRWTWDEFQALPRQPITADIHCVTKWSKFDTMWSGFSLDTLLAAAKPQAQYLLAFCDGGYVTNLPIADVTNNKAWIVDTYDGAPLPPEHGGPVRLLVPHLYFWKSAKWVRGLRIVADDQPGFWESLAVCRREPLSGSGTLCTVSRPQHLLVSLPRDSAMAYGSGKMTANWPRGR